MIKLELRSITGVLAVMVLIMLIKAQLSTMINFSLLESTTLTQEIIKYTYQICQPQLWLE